VTRLTDKRRAALHKELAIIKTRLRNHAVEVTFRRKARSLKEHIADIKRRDEIEIMLTEDLAP
jgi:hypothetical protein